MDDDFNSTIFNRKVRKGFSQSSQSYSNSFVNFVFLPRTKIPKIFAFSAVKKSAVKNATVKENCGEKNLCLVGQNVYSVYQIV